MLQSIATGHTGPSSRHALNRVALEFNRGPDLVQTQPLAAAEHTVWVMRWRANYVTPKCVHVRHPVDLNVVRKQFSLTICTYFASINVL